MASITALTTRAYVSKVMDDADERPRYSTFEPSFDFFSQTVMSLRPSFTLSSLHSAVAKQLSEVPGEASEALFASEDTRGRKRKVEEIRDSVPAAGPELGVRHADLWFEEGNVIITAVGLSFRVHSGILSRHSEVFGTLISPRALEDLPERLDGCPILRVPDNGDHLRKMLTIIYDGAKRLVNHV